MKRYVYFPILNFIFVFILLGCATTKQNYQRGWIGGEYLESDTSFWKKMCCNYFQSGDGVIPGLPEEIAGEQSSAILVSRVYDNTPVKNAGIKEGDLILLINNDKIKSVDKLLRTIDRIDPGEEVKVTLFREGQIIEKPLIIGKETYRKLHSISVGIALSSVFDPIPNPSFNLFSLLKYEKNNRRLELGSPEYQYYNNQVLKSNLMPKNEEQVNSEGWDTTIGIFGISGKKVILSQEVM